MGEVLTAIAAAGFQIRCSPALPSPASCAAALSLVLCSAAHTAPPTLAPLRLAMHWCSRLRLCQLSQAEAQQFYSVHRQQHFFPGLVAYMSSGPILALELVGQGAGKLLKPGILVEEEGRKAAAGNRGAGGGWAGTCGAATKL